jgi:replicative DNA helicase
MVIYPNNTEAEKAIIGALMADCKTHQQIFNGLTEEDFYSPECQNAFIAARNLYDSKKMVDVVAMSEFAELEFLTGCVMACYISSVPYYIRTLKEKTIRRQFIDAGRKIMELASGNEIADIVELKSEIVSSVDVKLQSETAFVEMPDVMECTFKNIEERMHKADQKLKYGLPWLDKHMRGLWDGELIIVGARPSVGKTAFALSTALFNGFRGFKIGFFNLEMTKEQMAERLLSNVATVSNDCLRNPVEMENEQWKKLGRASAELSRQNIYMVDDIYTIEGIEMKARMLKASKGLDIVFIDYLQLMTTRHKTNNTNDKVAHMSRQCKILAKELKIPVVLLSQLNRNANGKRPSLDELRDSGAIEQDADVVLFLHDPNYGKYQEAADQSSDIEIMIAKQRQGQRDIFNTFKYLKTVNKFLEGDYGN